MFSFHQVHRASLTSRKSCFVRYSSKGRLANELNTELHFELILLHVH